MITQNMPKYGGYTGDNTYFIIGNSWEKVEEELKDFIKEHGTEDNEIWVYREPGPKPSKINLRPEYTMGVDVISKDKKLLMLFGQERVWNGGKKLYG